METRKQKALSKRRVLFILLAFFHKNLYNESMITRAALLFERGGIVTGKSYSEILDIGHRFGYVSGYISGFTDSAGNFVDRNTALKIAKEAGQLPAGFAGPLTPEDLFGEDDATY